MNVLFLCQRIAYSMVCINLLSLLCKQIHLAAQSDQPDVVRLFLQKQPSLVTTTTKDGNTSAHIAAKKGSVRVLEELLKFDRNIVTTSRNRITDSTPLHVATEGTTA